MVNFASKSSHFNPFFNCVDPDPYSESKHFSAGLPIAPSIFGIIKEAGRVHSTVLILGKKGGKLKPYHK